MHACILASRDLAIDVHGTDSYGREPKSVLGAWSMELQDKLDLSP